MSSGILPDREIGELFASGALAAARPLDHDQIQPASLDLQARRARLARARQLPARPEPHRRRQARPPEAARDRPRPRRGAGNRLRLHRAAARKPGAAQNDLGIGQSEKLDRPARHLHPRHDRLRPGVRQDPGRLHRPALYRGQPAHLPDHRPHRLAAVADPLPRRQCAAVRGANCTSSMPARRWSPPRRRTFPAAASRCRSTCRGDADRLVGYRGKHHTGLVDVDKRDAQDVLDFWEPLYNHGTTAPASSCSTPTSSTSWCRAKRCTCRRLRRRDDAVRSAGRRIPRALCRLLRSGLRPFVGRRHRQRARCSKCAATRCRSSWSTARSSAAWSMSACARARKRSTAPTSAPTTRRRA